LNFRVFLRIEDSGSDFYDSEKHPEYTPQLENLSVVNNDNALNIAYYSKSY